MYSDNGNIASKSDVGDYSYYGASVRPNAVKKVTNPNGIVPNQQQDILYSSFGQPSKISENGREASYDYGADGQRRKGVLKNTSTNSPLWTRYYLGDYERQTTYTYGDASGSATQNIHYIGSPNGLVCIVTRQNGFNTFHYTYTDHLGSILTATNSTGVVEAEQNFDAWGRKRNPTDWTYSNVPNVPSWLYRGYTGHEHLPEFNLINMNGRLYDPLLARMLSPDNFIQSPFFSQSYNRYTYCFNNPLKYTDPSGETTFENWNKNAIANGWGYYAAGGPGNGEYVNINGVSTFVNVLERTSDGVPLMVQLIDNPSGFGASAAGLNITVPVGVGGFGGANGWTISSGGNDGNNRSIDIGGGIGNSFNRNIGLNFTGSNQSVQGLGGMQYFSTTGALTVTGFGGGVFFPKNEATKQFIAIVAGESSNSIDEAAGIGSVIVNRLMFKNTTLKGGFVNKIGGAGQYDAIGGGIYNSIMNSSWDNILSPKNPYLNRISGAIKSLSNVDYSGGAYFWNASSPQNGFNWKQYQNGTFSITKTVGGTTFFKYSSSSKIWP